MAEAAAAEAEAKAKRDQIAAQEESARARARQEKRATEFSAESVNDYRESRADRARRRLELCN